MSILPTKRSTKSNRFEDYSFLIHGEKKIGKTTMLAQEDNNLFFEYDPQQQALEIYQLPIRKWSTVQAGVKELEKKKKFTTITHDGVDIMYQLCLEHVCEKVGVSHPSEAEDFGATWNSVKREFSRTINRFLHLPGVSCRFIAHSIWREVKSRAGKVDRLVPTLTNQCEEILVGLVDGWFAYIYVNDRHVLVIRGNEEVAAGHRINHRFLTPDDRPVREIDLGDSEEEAYERLRLAFDNKQTYATLDELSKPKKAKKKETVRLPSRKEKGK